MELDRFKLHRRADAVLNELPPADRVVVLERLAALAKVPPREWVARQVKMPGADASLYLVRLNDSLRAFIDLPANGSPEVLDIVRQETLESFAKAM
jgi:hypothetical protein